MSAPVSARASRRSPVRSRTRRLARIFIREGRQSVAAILNYCEHTAGAAADFEDRLASTTIEPTASVLAAHADLTRELTGALITAGRALLKL